MAVDDYVPNQGDMTGILAASVAATVLFYIVSVASGVNITPRSILIMLIAFVFFSFITRQSGDYTAGFILITIAILMMLADYVLPQAVIQPFGFLVEYFYAVTGTDISQIDSWQFFVLSVVGVGFVIAARVRFGGSAGKYIDKVFDRVLREFRKYVDNYVTFGRLIAVFSFGVLVVVLEQMGAFAGAVGDRIAEAPFIASNIVTAIAGYASLGGVITIPNPFRGGPVILTDVPLFGSLDAMDFLFFAILVMLVAAASKYTGRGPLARIL